MRFAAALSLLLLSAACSSAPKETPAPAQLEKSLTEIEGTIGVSGPQSAPVAIIALADGRVFKVAGKLERMIRGVYRGQTIKLAGKITEPAEGGKPGVFDAREIVLILQ